MSDPAHFSSAHTRESKARRASQKAGKIVSKCGNALSRLSRQWWGYWSARFPQKTKEHLAARFAVTTRTINNWRRHGPPADCLAEDLVSEGEHYATQVFVELARQAQEEAAISRQIANEQVRIAQAEVSEAAHPRRRLLGRAVAALGARLKARRAEGRA